MGGRRITFCDCLETAPHCDSRCLFFHKVYYHFEGRLSVQFDLKEIMAVLFVNQQKYFEVINSPCYHNKELASPEQTATVENGFSSMDLPLAGCQWMTSNSEWRGGGGEDTGKGFQTHSCSCGGLGAVQD
ncbi:hypothetical protein Tco_1054375 [Tanacetum coccineum]|uniref:Uncharacterized protein n=1 Tax=Tanacetum coccineum TaxID=301880 RepID=A0ABQ5GZ08_9ASTR